MTEAQTNNLFPVQLGPLSSQRNLDFKTPIFEIETSTFFRKVKLKVYINRISIEQRSKFGFWEYRRTYNAVDIGEIFIRMGSNRAMVGANRINSHEILFELRDFNIVDAEAVKDALDMMLSYRFYISTSQPRINS